MMMVAFTGAVTTYAQFIFDYWKMIGINLATNIQTTWTNIKGNVSTILTWYRTIYSNGR